MDRPAVQEERTHQLQLLHHREEIRRIGQPIPNTPSVPYETDPNDPTKVVNGKVPEVPSWTPKNGKPGDPVVPADPSKDTKVPYDHTKTPMQTTVEQYGKRIGKKAVERLIFRLEEDSPKSDAEQVVIQTGLRVRETTH